MKQLFLLGISLLSVSACAPQSPPPPPAPAAVPAPTAVFDGTYGHGAVTAMSSSGCRQLSLPPNLTIKNGSAMLQWDVLTFQGNVTPEGALAMNAASGQTFQGQIDPHFVLTARVAGPNCTYDVTWSRVS